MAKTPEMFERRKVYKWYIRYLYACSEISTLYVCVHICRLVCMCISIKILLATCENRIIWCYKNMGGSKMTSRRKPPPCISLSHVCILCVRMHELPTYIGIYHVNKNYHVNPCINLSHVCILCVCMHELPAYIGRYLFYVNMRDQF